MPTPRVAVLCGSGLVGPTLGGWCVSTCPATAHRPTLRPLEGFTAGFLSPLQQRDLRTNHQHPEENRCLIYPPRSSDGT